MVVPTIQLPSISKRHFQYVALTVYGRGGSSLKGSDDEAYTIRYIHRSEDILLDGW